MADAPKDLRYLQTHEWHRLEGDTITIGITQIAADELTDITRADLPKGGQTVSANGRFGEIESVKATSDLYSGVSGTITAVNAALANNPGILNTDPYNAGWMIRVKPTNSAELEKLLDAAEYQQRTGH